MHQTSRVLSRVSNKLYCSLTKYIKHLILVFFFFAVRKVFSHISKALRKVWFDGLLYKLKRNDINSNLLKIIERLPLEMLDSCIKWANLQVEQN